MTKIKKMLMFPLVFIKRKGVRLSLGAFTNPTILPTVCTMTIDNVIYQRQDAFGQLLAAQPEIVCGKPASPIFGWHKTIDSQSLTGRPV